MAIDPFIPKKQGDLLFHEDWNELQARIQNHRHSGAFDGNAHFVNGSLGFNRVPADGSLPKDGDPNGGRYQLTPRPDRLTLESYTSAGKPSGGLSILAANGNVGIGTATPEAKLQLVTQNQDANGGILVLGPTNQSNLRLGYHTDYSWIQSHGSRPLAINPLGNNVGIRTATPATTLHTVGHVAASSADLGQFVQLWCDNAIIWRSGSSHAGLRLGSASNLAAGTWSEKVRLTDGGNFGIGTADPIGKLHVSGKAVGTNPIMQDKNDRPSISITGNYPQLVLMGQAANSNHGPTLMLGSYDSGSSTNMKHWSIGTSGQDSTFLDIGYHAGTDNNPHAGIRNHNGTTMMTFLSNGNVGIGTTKPSRLLHVEGDMYVKGQVKEGSSRRIKKNIEPLGETEAIAIFEGLETVRYEYAGFGDGRPHLGFIAEDVPDAVAAADRSSLCALEITAVLARTVKALQRKVEELEQRLAVVPVG